MDYSVSAFLDLYRLPTGRRLYALRQIRSQSGKVLGLPQRVREWLEEAIAFDERTWEMEVAWRDRDARAEDRMQAREADAELDRSLYSFHRYLEALSDFQGTALLDPDGRRSEGAVILLQLLFPRGAGYVTSLSYAEEVAETTRIVDLLRKDLADRVTQLGVGGLVDELERLRDALRLAIADDTERPQVSWNELRGRRVKGNEKLAQVVAIALGTYPGSSEEHIGARQTLLAGELEQREALREGYRTRRKPRDVDPQSGEELPGTDVDDA